MGIEDVSIVNFIVLLIISLRYSFKIKNYLNPLILFNLPIIFSYFGYYFILKNKYGTVSEVVTINYLITVFFFNFFYYLGWFSYKIEKCRYKLKIKYNFKIKIMLSIGIIITVMNIMKILTYLKKSNLPNIIFTLRHLASNLRFNFYFPHYMILFHLLLLILFVNFKKKKIVIIGFIALIINYFVLRVSRDALLIIILSFYMYSYNYNRYILEKKVFLRKFIILIFIFLLLFFIVAEFTIKIGESKLYTFLNYFSYQIIAFDKRLLNSDIDGFGTILTGPLKYIFNFFNMIELKSLKSILSSDKANVYGPAGLPYFDGGMSGVSFIYSIWGLLYSYVFKSATKGKNIYILLYSIIAFPLVTSFFDYKLQDIIWSYYLIIIILIFYLFKKIKIR